MTYLIIDREIEALWAIVDLRVFLACLADSGSVHEWGPAEVGLQARKQLTSHSQCFNIIRERSKEEVGVLPSQSLKMDMLEKGGRKGIEVMLDSQQLLLHGDIRVAKLYTGSAEERILVTI